MYIRPRAVYNTRRRAPYSASQMITVLSLSTVYSCAPEALHATPDTAPLCARDRNVAGWGGTTVSTRRRARHWRAGPAHVRVAAQRLLQPAGVRVPDHDAAVQRPRHDVLAVGAEVGLGPVHAGAVRVGRERSDHVEHAQIDQLDGVVARVGEQLRVVCRAGAEWAMRGGSHKSASISASSTARRGVLGARLSEVIWPEWMPVSSLTQSPERMSQKRT